MQSQWQTPQQLWLRPCNRPVHRTTRLVCLPHAGGTAQGYRSWLAAAPADVGVYAVQYPGRQDRFDEPLVDDVARMVELLSAAIAPWVGERLSLFGHSMGALVAYELTLELERRHGPVVDLLVVSGSPAPHTKAPSNLHRQDDAALIADVIRLNPSAADLLHNPDLVDVLVPMIRADYRLTETYRRADPLPVHSAVLAVGGNSDPDLSVEDLERWSAVARGRCEVLTFPGDHFYLLQEGSSLVSAITARLPGRRKTAPMTDT
jgi:pyochelin biosynthetic protein PchC